MKEIIFNYLGFNYNFCFEVEYIDIRIGMFMHRIPIQWIQKIKNKINGDDESVPFLHDLHVVFNLSPSELKSYLNEWFNIKKVPFNFDVWWNSAFKTFEYEKQKVRDNWC